MGRIDRCRGCGKEIIWIRMESGKNMPADPDLEEYVLGGNDTFITMDGKVVVGKLCRRGEADGVGYKPHWATCIRADTFRRK